MRFRSGLVIGLAVGYYLGARAGRERYEQIEAWLDRARDTAAYRQARDRVTEAWADGAGAGQRVLADLTRPEPQSGDDPRFADTAELPQIDAEPSTGPTERPR